MKKKEFDLNKLLLRLIPVFVGLVLLILGFVAPHVKLLIDHEVAFKFFGLFVIGVYLVVEAVKSKEHQVLKSILAIFATTLVMTWFIPIGEFAQLQFINVEMQRVGFTDLSLVIYYALYYNLDKILFLFALSGFYYLLSQNKGYRKLISSIAKSQKGFEKITIFGFAIAILILTTFISQTFIVFLFIPFMISILSKMKVDKLTAFAVTVGALLVGLVGAPYGSEGLWGFSYNASIGIGEGLAYRLIIQGIVLIGYLAFLYTRLNVLDKKEKSKQLIEDPYDVKDVRGKENIVPITVTLSIFALILVVGFINWSTYFNATLFTDFHTWLMGFEVGGSPIFALLLGSMAKAIGTWDVITGIMILTVFYIVVAILNKANFDDVVESFVEGFKIIIKPALFLVATYLVFIVLYLSPFTMTLSNWAYSLTEGFQFVIAPVLALITSVFHADLGFTGFAIGNYITRAFEDNLGLIQSTYVSMHGFAQIFVPTSGILVVGLALFKVNYKDWLKYIFYFLASLFVVLLIVFAIIQYSGL